MCLCFLQKTKQIEALEESSSDSSCECTEEMKQTEMIGSICDAEEPELKKRKLDYQNAEVGLSFNLQISFFARKTQQHWKILCVLKT